MIIQRNNGIKLGISAGSRHGPTKKDGKGRPSTSPAAHRKPSKYTIVRKQPDIELLEKLRRILKDNYGQTRYNTDAEIYRDLPMLYLDAVKQGRDLDHQVEVLTAELAQLEELRSCFCRILELCNKQRKVKE